MALVKNPGDSGSVPGLGRSPVEGNSNWIQYSCLENTTDRGGWSTTIHGVSESDMTERLSTHTYFISYILYLIQNRYILNKEVLPHLVFLFQELFNSFLDFFNLHIVLPIVRVPGWERRLLETM